MVTTQQTQSEKRGVGEQEEIASSVATDLEIANDEVDEYYQAVLNDNRSAVRAAESRAGDWVSTYELANSEKNDTMASSKRWTLSMLSLPGTMAGAIPYAVTQEPVLGLLPLGVAVGTLATVENDIREQKENQKIERAEDERESLEQELTNVRYGPARESVERILSDSVVVTYEHSSERFLASEGYKTGDIASREYTDVLDVLEERAMYWKEEEMSVPLSQSEEKLMTFDGDTESVEDEFIRENMEALRNDYNDRFVDQQYEHTAPDQVIAMKEVELDDAETFTVYRLRVNAEDEEKLDVYGLHDGSIDELDYIFDSSRPLTEAVRDETTRVEVGGYLPGDDEC